MDSGKWDPATARRFGTQRDSPGMLPIRGTSRVIIWNVRLVPGSDTRNDGTTCRKPVSKAIVESVVGLGMRGKQVLRLRRERCDCAI
jgi:hypothetical protein